MSQDNDRAGISRVSAFRARLAGVAARRADQPSTSNPHNPSGSFRDRTLARYWMRGWVRADAVLRQRAT